MDFVKGDNPLLALLPILLFTSIAFIAARGSTRSSTLILQRFSIGLEPSPPIGPVIEIICRNEGIVAFLLTLMGFSPITRFTIAGSELECQSSSLFGQRSQFIPLSCISSLGAGIHKPLLSLILAIASIIVGIYLSLVMHSWAPIAIALIFAVILIVLYVLTKKFYIEVYSHGGPPVSLLFKPNVLEGVPIDAEQALAVVAVIRDLILQHSSSEVIRSSTKKTISSVGIKQKTNLTSNQELPVIMAQPAVSVGSNAEFEAKALYEKARQYAGLNQKQAAVPLLQEIVRRYGQTSFADQARRILAKYKAES